MALGQVLPQLMPIVKGRELVHWIFQGKVSLDYYLYQTKHWAAGPGCPRTPLLSPLAAQALCSFLVVPLTFVSCSLT